MLLTCGATEEETVHALTVGRHTLTHTFSHSHTHIRTRTTLQEKTSSL